MDKSTNKSGEFSWIEKIRERFASLVPAQVEGIGDDCAVLPAGAEESFVVSTDMLVEDVHFIKDKISAQDLGYKSLAVNLSDIASMGASPVGSFLSIGFPPGVDESCRESFLTGYQELSTAFQVPLLGGDTVSSEKLVINVTVLGKAGNEHIKRRSGAKPGDLICVTGNLGDSAAGLKTILGEISTSPELNPLIDAHYRPKPYIKEGIWLGKHNAVHAMMDVSDGIASDLSHILEASGVSAEIELTCLPLSTPLKNVSACEGWNPYELAVSGGEDYVLLFTVDPEYIAPLTEGYNQFFDTPFYVIGRIIEGAPNIHWTENGTSTTPSWKGFSHF